MTINQINRLQTRRYRQSPPPGATHTIVTQEKCWLVDCFVGPNQSGFLKKERFVVTVHYCTVLTGIVEVWLPPFRCKNENRCSSMLHA